MEFNFDEILGRIPNIKDPPKREIRNYYKKRYIYVVMKDENGDCISIHFHKKHLAMKFGIDDKKDYSDDEMIKIIEERTNTSFYMMVCIGGTDD